MQVRYQAAPHSDRERDDITALPALLSLCSEFRREFYMRVAGA